VSTRASIIITFPTAIVRRLAGQIRQSLKLNEDPTTPSSRIRVFDFEPSIDEAETLTPRGMIFYITGSRARPAGALVRRSRFQEETGLPGDRRSARKVRASQDVAELLPRVHSEYGGKPLEG